MYDSEFLSIKAIAICRECDVLKKIYTRSEYKKV